MQEVRMMKTIAVFSMCLNEIHFIELYLRSNLRFATEIIVIDGGSTDGTLDVLERYCQSFPDRITYEVMPQVGEPYSKDWDTATRRQRCIDLASSDWVLQLDIDEIVSDRFVEELPGILNDERALVYPGAAVSFNFVSFWRDFNTVRVNHEHDRGHGQWSGPQVKMWRNNGTIEYRNEWHHSGPGYPHGVGLLVRTDIDIYHLHYADKRFLKYNDNRRGDLGCDRDLSNPNWERQDIPEYRIGLEPFRGQHPALLKEMGFIL